MQDIHFVLHCFKEQNVVVYKVNKVLLILKSSMLSKRIWLFKHDSFAPKCILYNNRIKWII